MNEPRASERKPARAGWVVLIILLAGILVAVGLFLYLGPWRAHRNVKHIAKPETYERVFEKAIALYSTLPKDSSLYGGDPRARELSEVLSPAKFSFVVRLEDELIIECGGGFYHYGFKLIKNGTNRFTLILQEEETADRILAAKAPLIE